MDPPCTIETLKVPATTISHEWPSLKLYNICLTHSLSNMGHFCIPNIFDPYHSSQPFSLPVLNIDKHRYSVTFIYRFLLRFVCCWKKHAKLLTFWGVFTKMTYAYPCLLLSYPKLVKNWLELCFLHTCWKVQYTLNFITFNLIFQKGA